MLNGLKTRIFQSEFAHKALAGFALVGAGLASSYAFAETLSQPYPGVARARYPGQEGSTRRRPSSTSARNRRRKWKGPTVGPKCARM